MSITLTKSAAQRIAEQVEKHQAIGLRFSVKMSGCSGYSYDMGFAQEIQPEDTVIEQKNLKVIIDKQSLPILEGTQIDYVTNGLNQTFKFSNPKATDECGCGESFAIEG